MNRIVACLSVSFALVFTGCDEAPKPPDKAAVEKSVRDAEAAWAKETQLKDASKMAAHYTSDAIVMGGGSPAAKGTDAIRAMFAQIFADPNASLTFTTDRVEVADSGEMAVTRGTYNMTMSNPATKKAMTDKGSYVTVFHKQTDGGWKASLDIIASDGPPPAPPAPKAAKKAAGKKKRR